MKPTRYHARQLGNGLGQPRKHAADFPDQTNNRPFCMQKSPARPDSAFCNATFPRVELREQGGISCIQRHRRIRMAPQSRHHPRQFRGAVIALLLSPDEDSTPAPLPEKKLRNLDHWLPLLDEKVPRVAAALQTGDPCNESAVESASQAESSEFPLNYDRICESTAVAL